MKLPVVGAVGFHIHIYTSIYIRPRFTNIHLSLRPTWFSNYCVRVVSTHIVFRQIDIYLIIIYRNFLVSRRARGNNKDLHFSISLPPAFFFFFYLSLRTWFLSYLTRLPKCIPVRWGLWLRPSLNTYLVRRAATGPARPLYICKYIYDM